MGSFRFSVANVFAETHFGGNQLVVFPDARGLPEGAMQAVARQFNVSETTFVLPASRPDHSARVRIFTPATELPFAGHPTIGTAAVLARSGHGGSTLILEENAGPVAVEVRLDDTRTYARFTLDRPVEQPDEAVDRAAVAEALSLDAASVRDAWVASAGVPFCFVRLADSAAVDGSVLDRTRWLAKLSRGWSANLFFFADGGSPGRFHARMFAPGLGVDEDPATGAAVAALVGSLAERVGAPDGVFEIVVDQGVRMGRPSVIEASADMRGGKAGKVAVGGNTIVVAEGSMSIPAQDPAA